MTDTVYYTQLVSAFLPAERRIQLRESFAILGFSVRPYVNDGGFTSKVKFYVDYTNQSLITLWLVQYGGVFPEVRMFDVFYP